MRDPVVSLSLNGVANLAVMAPVRDGPVPGFESITYAERLERLLRALNTARVALREAALHEPAFPDAIGRFETIHHFRYAVFDPADHGSVTAAPDTAEDRGRWLTLNVTFDGGFEPYMRVIYRDIGTLLDALFCHVIDYPGSRTSHYIDYCRWVRAHELDGGLNYVDSAHTLGDTRWTRDATRAWLDAPTPQQADLALAGLANPPLERRLAEVKQRLQSDPAARQRTLWQTLRSLKGLHRLLPFFPANEQRDDLVLKRFARDLLRDGRWLIGWLEAEHAAGRLAAAEAEHFKKIAALFAEEIGWIRPLDRDDPPQLAPPPAFDPTELQAGVLHGHGNAPCTHGLLLLMAVADRDRALDFLAGEGAPTPEGTAPADGVWRNVGFTPNGLEALGVDKSWRNDLAPEFREGMEARCGLLGDLRSNHPDRWRRPLRPGAPADADDGDRIELMSVHVAVILRTVDDGKHPGHGGHPAFDADWARRLRDPALSGLAVLAEQPMRSWPEPSPHEQGRTRTQDHFGFLDGFSQPKPLPEPGKGARDEVPLGDLLLGHANGLDDPPWPAHGLHPLLHNGSYMAVRVLRQHLDRLDEVLRQADPAGVDDGARRAARRALADRLMGRHADGRALVPLASGASPVSNDFSFDADPNGSACPFASHVRRTNPRDGRKAMPRIVRRGMSYGPRLADDRSNLADERGLVFMALCSSLAEQFETVQRWVAGGNASGVPSMCSDPFLGVPPAEGSRKLRWIEGQGTAASVRSVDLGVRPLVELQWGLYLFVPSLPVLRGLRALAVAPPERGRNPAPPPDTPSAFEASALAWRAAFDHPAGPRRIAAWKAVRTAGGTAKHAFGTLLGSFGGVRAALRDSGSGFSTAGYGERMDATIGLGYLGADPSSGSAPWAGDVNRLIGAIGAGPGCGAAWAAGGQVLKGIGVLLAMTEGGGSRAVPIDLIAYSDGVLGGLCRHWFGLPDGVPGVTPAGDKAFMWLAGRRDGLHSAGDRVRCPGHLMAVSRHVFNPWPGDEVKSQAESQGRAFAGQVKVWLTQTPADRHTPLVRAVLAEMTKHGITDPADDRVVATLGGLMLGFAPTVHGNFMRLLQAWQDSGRLWALQPGLRQASAAAADEATRVGAVLGHLRPAIVEALRECAVPEVVWRRAGPKAPTIGREAPAAGEPVLLGLASAVRERLDAAPSDPRAQADADAMVFGGLWTTQGQPEAHACPGREMALGVLAGMVGALLLQDGTLRRTGSPIQLLWLRR